MRLKIWILTTLFSLSAFSSANADNYALATLEWPPYTVDDDEVGSYARQVVQEAFAAANASATEDFLPWNRGLIETQQGKYVGIYPEYYDVSREDQFVFSNPFPGGAIGLLKLSINKHIQYGASPILDGESEALKSLRDYRFGIVRGYLNTPAFDRSDFLKKTPTRSDQSNLRMLERGRVDLIMIDQLVAEYIIQDTLPQLEGKTTFLKPALATKDLYIAFSKAHPKHLEAQRTFNKGLNILKNSGRLNELVQQYGIPTP